MTPTTFATVCVTVFALGNHSEKKCDYEQARAALLIDPANFPVPTVHDIGPIPTGADHGQRLVEQFGFLLHRQHRTLCGHILQCHSSGS